MRIYAYLSLYIYIFIYIYIWVGPYLSGMSCCSLWEQGALRGKAIVVGGHSSCRAFTCASEP